MEFECVDMYKCRYLLRLNVSTNVNIDICGVDICRRVCMLISMASKRIDIYKYRYLYCLNVPIGVNVDILATKYAIRVNTDICDFYT